jgi:RNA polymerase sigma factor (sigma-70 family)
MESTSILNAWQEYQQGKPEARNRLFAAFIPRIVGLAKKCLKGATEMEDLKQSVLVSVFKNHEPEFRNLKEFGEVWDRLAAITMRHCGKHNKRRARAAQRGPMIRVAGGTSSVPACDPADDGVSPDERAAIHDLFEECQKQLSPRQQEILGMHLRERDRREIAASLEISIPTVDRELKAIKRRLARLAAG